MFFRELLWGRGDCSTFYSVMVISIIICCIFLFYIFIIKGNKIYMVENNSLGDGFKLPK